MAKGNMLLGYARGKVGSLVFSRLNGVQITRAKADKVSNPRTDSQCVQRAIFATVAKATSALQGIVDHSFQNVGYGPDSLRHFRKVNLDYLRSRYLNGGYVDLLTKGESATPANEYRISEGSIPKMPIIYAGSTFFILANLAHTDGSDVVVPMNALTSQLQIMPGDQITLVALINRTDFEGTEEGFSRFVVHRVVINDDVQPTDNVINQNGFISGVYDPNVTTAANLMKVITIDNNHYVGIRSDAFCGDGEEVFAMTYIISRYDTTSKKWLRSTQSLIINDSIKRQNDGDQSAIDSYGNNDSLASSNEYLNQAETDTDDLQTTDTERGNLIIKAYNGTGDTIWNEKFSYADGSEDTLRNASGGVINLKGTTFKNVEITYMAISRTPTGTGLPVAVADISAARKLATLQWNIPAEPAGTYYVIVKTLYNGRDELTQIAWTISFED